MFLSGLLCLMRSRAELEQTFTHVSDCKMDDSSLDLLTVDTVVIMQTCNDYQRDRKSVV